MPGYFCLLSGRYCTGKERGNITYKHAVFTIIAAAAAVIIFPRLPQMLYKAEYGSPVYLYTFSIPVLAWFLIWLKIDALKELPVSSSLAGLPVSFAGLGMCYAGVRVAGSLLLSGAGIVCVLIGLTLWMFGRTVASRTAFPLGLIVFAFPMPEPWIESIGAAMGSFQYPFVLLIISIVYGYGTGLLWYEIAFLAIISLPVAVIAGVLRNSAVLVAARTLGSQSPDEAVHILAGVLFLVVAIGVLTKMKKLWRRSV